jgi:hypothetical protein
VDVTPAYLTSAKNFPDFLAAIQKAPAPPRVTVEFLRSLGFKSTNDRAFIGVLKGLGLTDQSGVPTQAYRDYRDTTAAKRVLARQIKVAYKGLFATDEHAEALSANQLKGRLSTLTNKDAGVVQKMVTTFTTLVAQADFTDAESLQDIEAEEERAIDSPAGVASAARQQAAPAFTFSHVIFINLPATTDVAVYDAIFKSLRENIT